MFLILAIPISGSTCTGIIIYLFKQAFYYFETFYYVMFKCPKTLMASTQHKRCYQCVHQINVENAIMSFLIWYLVIIYLIHHTYMYMNPSHFI